MRVYIQSKFSVLTTHISLHHRHEYFLASWLCVVQLDIDVEGGCGIMKHVIDLQNLADSCLSASWRSMRFYFLVASPPLLASTVPNSCDRAWLISQASPQGLHGVSIHLKL